MTGGNNRKHRKITRSVLLKIPMQITPQTVDNKIPEPEKYHLLNSIQYFQINYLKICRPGMPMR